MGMLCFGVFRGEEVGGDSACDVGLDAHPRE